ncbi:MAG: ABC transporter substrate-binding protein [Desulfobacterales bacterium]|nr:ABC transporter substrate-binding protein [Desulfobacterales bacterium]
MIKMMSLMMSLVLMFYSQIGFADDKEAVAQLLDTTFKSVFTILDRKDIDQQTKNNEVLKVVTPLFNFSLMAQLSLKKYWPTLTDAQKEKFISLFTENLQRSYLDYLALYTNEKITQEAPVQEGNKLYVQTYLLSKVSKISMLYKFYSSAKGLQIYDFELQGTSIMKTKQTDYYQVMEKSSFDDLLLFLSKNAKPSPSK